MNWQPHDSELWGCVPQCIQHNMHCSELFSDSTLAGLIEVYPEDQYNLIQWTEERGKRDWREGKFGNMKGKAILDAISKSKVFVNLKNVGLIDSRYQKLAEAIFEELEARVKGFVTFKRIVGILISSPMSATHYHSDTHATSIWQIRGRKQFFVYPTTLPFMDLPRIEDNLLTGVEIEVPYEKWFDDHAAMYILEPGQMLHWPHRAPHRVQNLDSLNVSMTVEYRTKETHRKVVVGRANAILRVKFGLRSLEPEASGLTYYGKAALQFALRNSSSIRSKIKSTRKIDFQLSDEIPSRLADI